MPRQQRMTIYDLMEAAGKFATNPANADARGEDGAALYEGPVEYPRMFYHPLGEERIIKPAEMLTYANGQPVIDSKSGEPKMVGEQREIIWELAKTPEDAEVLRDAGWHDHPAKAIAASGRQAPPTGASEQIADLQEQLRKLQTELAAKAKPETPLQRARASAKEMGI